MGVAMFFQVRRLIFGVTCLALSVAPAFAQTTPATTYDPMIAYRAYDQAVAEGKLADAAAHAQVAWKNAETTWGPTNANTAGLAFNAAWSLALIGKAPDGMEAAKRAVELADVGAKAYRASEARFLLAYAELQAAPVLKKRQRAEALGMAAKAIEGTWGDALIVDALVDASIHLSTQGRSKTGADLAARANNELNRLLPTDQTRRAQILLAQAVSKLANRETVSSAYSDIIDARLAYGPMRQTDDPTWGALSAWQLVIRGIYQIGRDREVGTGSNIMRAKDALRDITPEESAKLGNALPDCQKLITSRKKGWQEIEPNPRGNYSMNLGGVHIRTDLSPDGRVLNPRVLGVLPDSYYAEASIKAIATWQYDIPANVPATCLKDYDITVVFSMY